MKLKQTLFMSVLVLLLLNTSAKTWAQCVSPGFTSCPLQTITGVAASDQCSADVSYTVSVTGTPVPDITYAFSGATSGSGSGDGSGNSFNVGITQVTLTATNGCGTATCNFNVEVADNQPPFISCPATINSCSPNVSIPLPQVSDNCIPTNSALDFDGGNDYLSFTNDLSSITEFTYEAWVNVRNQGNWARILDFGNAAGINIFLTSSVGNSGIPRFAINIGYGEQTITAPSPLPLNTWTHIAVTLGGSEAIMYINGTEVAHEYGFTYTPADMGPSVNNWIGRSQYDADSYFNGQMDEVRLWNVARTQAQIQASMNTSLLVPQAGLMAFFNFDEGIAGGNNTGITMVTDYSGNSFTGTLNNFTLTGNVSNFVEFSGEPLSVTIVNDFNNTADASGYYPMGTTVVTWTATDASGNSSTCLTTVIVEDDIPPTIDCGGPLSFSCPGPLTLPVPFATDNCTGNSGNALNFDGDDYFEGDNPDLPNGTDPFTVEAWIYPVSSQNGTIFDWGTFDVNVRSSLLYIDRRIYFSGYFNDRIGNTYCDPGS